jgi:AcrR family transcriptional regulator
MAAGPGRPRASSRRTIEEAALELFLENGYGGTSIDDIARRAGVGRATVFSYVTAKSDLLWFDADAALDDLVGERGRGTPVLPALLATARRVGADRVPLAVTQADLLGVRAELELSAMPRLARLERLLRAGVGLEARVEAASLAAATAVAWMSWAAAGIGRGALVDTLERALATLEPNDVDPAITGESPEEQPLGAQ